MSSRWRADLRNLAGVAIGGDDQIRARGGNDTVFGDFDTVDASLATNETIQGGDDMIGGFAAVALGIVADKEPLPWNSKISININYRANTQTLTDSEQGTGILDIL